MKKYVLLFLTALLVAGCEKQAEDIADVGFRDVRFHMTGDGWSVSTRALQSDGHDMTDLWLFDYLDGELVATVHKVTDDVDFEEPTLHMRHGRHQVYIVASRGKTPTVSGTEITWQTPSDTFWKNIAIDVSLTSSPDVTVAIDRVATKLSVKITDEIPDGASVLVMKPSTWFYGIDYQTGEAVGESDAERRVSLPASYVGTTGQLAAGFYGLSDSGEWATDIRVAVLDADGNTMGEVALPDVPFLRNRVTEASGGLFSSSTGFHITLNDEWLDTYSIEW